MVKILYGVGVADVSCGIYGDGTPCMVLVVLMVVVF